MRAKTMKARSIGEVRSFVEESSKDGFTPTLAIVFTSLTKEFEAIQQTLTSAGIAIFGASSNGEFIDNDHETGSIVIMLLDMNNEWFNIEISDVIDTNVCEISQQIGVSAKKSFKNPAFIISGAHTSIASDEIITGLIEACGEHVTIVGGNSAADNMMGGFVFSNHSRSDKGVIALVMDEDKIKLTGEAISGWKPVGTTKTVTNSSGNWVYTLDDKPALDSLIKYMGTDIDFSNKEDLYEKIGSIYPIQILHDDGTSHILPPLYFDQDQGSFMLAGPIKEGTKVRFSLPPDFDVVDKVVDSSMTLRDNELAEIDAMIIFSCAGRLNCLGPLVTDEITGLVNTWKVPSIGFFTFGEYGRVKNGKPMFHGTTVSWVTLKEK